jgi:four helix bundle protein
MEAKDDPAVAVTKAYDLALWILPKVEKFPRSYRFSIGERLACGALDVLLDLVAAAYASDKGRCLESAGREVNRVRYLLRLAKDLKLISRDAYNFAAERVDEVGRMVGGWRKSSRRPG